PLEVRGPAEARVRYDAAGVNARWHPPARLRTPRNGRREPAHLPRRHYGGLRGLRQRLLPLVRGGCRRGPACLGQLRMRNPEAGSGLCPLRLQGYWPRYRGRSVPTRLQSAEQRSTRPLATACPIVGIRVGTPTRNRAILRGL